MTSFGEIVEPVSRSAWEDWDEVIPENNITELKWQVNLESPGDIDIFILFEGKYLSDWIKYQTCNLELINTVPEVHLQLYRSKVSDKYICTVNDYNILLSSEIVELLQQYLIVSKNVTVVQTKPLAEYQSANTIAEDCVIRAVYTSKNMSPDLKFPKLEQPNIISGVSAGVISLREHLNESGTALVCYMEYPEEYLVEEMEKLLEKLDISTNTKSRPSTVLSSNLYI